jgi:hypothetical protein
MRVRTGAKAKSPLGNFENPRLNRHDLFMAIGSACEILSLVGAKKQTTNSKRPDLKLDLSLQVVFSKFARSPSSQKQTMRGFGRLLFGCSSN